MDNADREAGSDKGVLLVVDDERHYLEALRRLLRRHGHVVHAADDGETALRLAPELRPDLILLDIRMPSLDSPAGG